MTDEYVYENGVALLEEWEDVNYCEHSFKFKDEWLTDEEVVDKLNELNEENQSVKDILNELNEYDGYWDSAILTDIIERIAVKLGVDLNDRRWI